LSKAVEKVAVNDLYQKLGLSGEDIAGRQPNEGRRLEV
jgi:hypothetical protein